MAPPFRTILTLYVLTLSLGLVSYSLIPTSTCTSTIKTTEQYFSVNEPIPISYSIKDVSKDTITIWHCGFWCNNKIVVTDDNNIELPRTDWGKTTLSAFSPGGDRNKNFPVKLAPGDTDSAYEKYNLKDHFLFKRSGTYNVKYFYHEYDGRAEVKIESNTLTIHIQLK
jgi:hypothetical protein